MTLGLVVGALLACATCPALAQPMRLEDVIRAALKDGPDLQHEEEKVRRAAGALQEAQGAFDWNAAAQTGWEKLYVARTSGGFLTDNIDSIDAIHTTIGVSRQFRNGIAIRPGISFYSNAGASDAQTFGVTKPRPSLGLTIPLLRGLGEESADAAELAAQEALKGTQFDRSFALQRIVHDAVQAYWRCIAAFAHVDLLVAADQDAADYVDFLRQMVGNGALEPTLLQRAEANLVVRRVNLNRAEDAIAICQRDLALLTGQSNSRAVPVPVGRFPLTDAPNPPELQLSIDSLLDRAVANRKDLRALERFASAESIRLRGARDGLSPTLDVYIDPTRAGLRFTKSLDGNLEEGRVQQAVAADNEARLKLQQLQSKIRIDIADAVRNLQQARLNYVALGASAQLLETAVADAKRRVQAGQTERPDYRGAQEELATARHQMVDSSLEYAANLAALRLATGAIDANEAASPAILAPLFLSLPRP